MGHYDSAYAYDEDQRAKKLLAERKADAKLFLIDVEKLQLLSEGPIDLPQRFRDALVDMKNWVTVEVTSK